MIKGKKILLAVCGSIAAYKTAFLIRLLTKAGAEVKVVMTESAKDFITPLTLATLSKNDVLSDFFEKKTGSWTSHIELGLWADLMLIAPATADTIAKMAGGQCDNLLTATYLSARCDVWIAPAMDLDMYSHPSTQQNLKTLRNYGNTVIEARTGELASGLEGQGRMAEPEELAEMLKSHFAKKKELTGKKVLITSGPTHEPIDAVRFIGNRSSGKMGKALALSCADQGADVLFVSGPVQVLPEHEKISVIPIQRADDMFKEVEAHYSEMDISIFAAAVSDYRVKESVDGKIKRSGESLDLELVENPDIALEMGKRKQKDQLNIGFALETSDDPANAQDKMNRKNFDMIVLNSLSDANAGFGHETNKITIFTNNKSESYQLKNKTAVADDIVKSIIALM